MTKYQRMWEARFEELDELIDELAKTKKSSR